MSVGKVVGLCAVAFSVALAVVVGNRMSAEAMAVVIGVVCGVAASIPMSALILAMSRRTHSTAEGRREPSPPVVIVTSQPPAQVQPTWPASTSPAIPAPREYRIVGDER